MVEIRVHFVHCYPVVIKKNGQDVEKFITDAMKDGFCHEANGVRSYYPACHITKIEVINA
jgi:hypothetical protein